MTPSQPSLPLRLFTLAFVFSIFTTLLGVVLSWQMHLRGDEVADRHVALAQSIGRIMLLDDALTMSARMAAATGDMSYEQHHDQLVPQLTTALNTAKDMLPQEEIARFVEKTNAANNAVMKMERQAFDLMHQGKRQEAMALLNGDEYMRLEKVYADGLAKTTRAAEALIEHEDRRLHWLAFWLSMLNAAGVVVLLAVWGLALRSARRWETERKQNEQALARLQRSQEQILDSIGEGILGIDLEGNVTFENPAAMAMLGWSLQEMVGHYAHSMMHRTRADGSPYPPSECNIYATLHHGATCHIEDEVFWRKDGTSFPVAYTSTPMKNEAGEIEGAIVSFLDITERKQNELALVAAQRDLQTAYEMIVRKNAQLEESSRARSEFLATMSHELKTPLNAVIGFSDLLREGTAGPVNEEQRGFAQDIYDAGTKLLGLLSDIIDFARLEAGYARLELKPVTADVWLKESVMSWHARATASGLTFTLDIPEALGTLWMDASKARQIVVNLLSNAVKFTRDGGVVTIAARRVAQAQARVAGNTLPGAFAEYLEIEVRDTGIGFPPELLPKLFEPFHQGDATSTREYEGIGLGLAMVKRLVDLHGGVVQAYNAPDHGACVTVWLPWRGHPANQEGATQAVDNPLLALLIEDDPKAADLIRLQLESEGLQVIIAGTAALGLQLAVTERPALITLDILLPDMDGWTLLEQLKSTPSLAHIPVVVISIVADRKRGMTLGAASVIQKPYKHGELRKALARVRQVLNSAEFDEMMFLNEVRRALKKT